MNTEEKTVRSAQKVAGFNHVLVTYESLVATVTLNRPDKLNAINRELHEDMVAALTQVTGDRDVRVIVITGAGRAFCAGADIGYMRELLETDNRKSAEALVEAGRALVTAIRESPKAVIASVNGPAAGGGANLALACDIRIASDRASIGQTFTRIGLHPDWGATYFLPRLVGPSKAAELFFTGEVLDAAEAHRLGLFTRLVPHERLEAETAQLAQTLAARPPLALALAKRATYHSESCTLGQMLDVELDHQMQCFRSEDATEGLASFLEKRPPKFTGK
ncbi:MAG: enoyl-CoA hydratase [Gemmatimonadetes bacterium]|nr:enoyl-CoA hydratase [Gemmatimonadota bacterium]